MSTTITTIRAIGAEFALRLFIPVVVISMILATLLIIAVVSLSTLSEWWLLLLIPVIILISVTIGVLAISWLVVRTVRPVQTRSQLLGVKAFVDKLQRVSEAAQTPKIVLLFRIIRDIASPSKNGFIGTLTEDTSSLTRDFRDLQKLFQ